MEALTDPVRLRMTCLCFRMIDVVNGEEQLVIMVLDLAAVFRPPISQNAEQIHTVIFKQWQDTIIEQIRRGDWRLLIVELRACHA